MRFLCLHGRGTNSDIFESQLGKRTRFLDYLRPSTRQGIHADFFNGLAALVSRIAPHHTFDFVDAPFECSAAPGISEVYPAPYLAWHSRYDPEYVSEVHDFLASVIEEDGPYDGIMGFSQGASLAASLLLCHEHIRCSRPDEQLDPLFKVAIFFNAVMLFSPSREIGSNITEAIKLQEEKHMGFLKGEPQFLPSPEFELLETSSTTSSSAPIVFKMPNWSSTSSTSLSSLSSISSAEDEPSQEIKRARKRSVALESLSLLKAPTVFGFPPEITSYRIPIPTLHVMGAEDEFAEHSEKLVQLCRADKAEVMRVRDGGHDLPRTKTALDECARLFDFVTMMASLG
ncbi:hypothetical protein H2198_006694 [Neophaeococcomyces mojaviensis]|uniref:Uncharacterized protein n=1 Tax=Neophaeococcomyces mojaviensis TaxID=3383035 RepID=A0ACC3A2J9_9EURO|nr:hypothetical protein H2198_006694 [Knufia sp. JES_112]